MSALPPKADMCGARADVRLVPIADVIAYSITSSARASSVGGTARPSALAVLRLIDQLILGRRLHRKVGGLLAFKDAVNIVSGAPELIDQIRSVGDETTGSNERPVEINSWQPVFYRKPDNEVAMTVRRRAGSNNQTSIGGAGEGRNRALNLGGVAQVDLVYLHPERRCHGLDDAELGNTGRYAGISKHRRSCQAWHNLFE